MKRLYPFLSRKRVAIVEACIIGLVSGLAAVALKQGVESLIQWRSEPIVSTWLLLPTIGLVGGWLSGWAIQQFAPETSGSGIPHVKAVLGYVPMPLNLRVALVKLVSTLLALGSGLSLGRQGPTVQIGAALAAQLSHWVPTSPEYRRQLISAGAAAGLAAGFNAPISGILFVVEELLQDFSGLTLGSAILASFVGAVVSRLLGGQGLNLTMGTLSVGLGLADLPFLVLLGLLAGVLGTLFNRGIFASLSFFRRMKGISLPGRVGLAGLLTGLVGVWLPVAAQDNTGLREFLITGEAGWQLIAVAFLAKFGLTLIAYGSGAAGGIFAPTLVLGSALGCLVSFLAQGIYGGLGLPLVAASTTTYALTGMGAFFSAVTRVPITAIVIVFEMTANFNLVLPLMIGAGIAYLISERVASGSIYSGLLHWQGIELEATPTTTNPWMNLTAADLMQRRVETLSSQMTLQEAMEAFSRSHHRGFPVVDAGRLVGIVTQSDLGAAKVQGREATLPLTEIMTPHPVTVSPNASLTQVLHLLNQLKISRLPVTQEGKLVGIITRGDIIRAESDQVSGQANPPGPQASPSYPVYQTRGPATGQGRLLLPLSDPSSAPLLLQMALAMAKAQHYEVECLHVIKVPRSVPPAEATVDLRSARRLLSRAERLGRRQGVSVHGQIRVAHEVARTLLEVIKERHIDLILMGWQRQTKTPGRVLGAVVDTVIRQVPCPVVVVRPGKSLGFNRWLVPTAGGPNSQRALELLPGLLQLGHSPKVQLCHIATTDADQRAYQDRLIHLAEQLQQQLQVPVTPMALVRSTVADAIVQLAQKYETQVILLGASRENLLSQVLHGNIPVEIAQNTRCTVILVRHAGIEDIGAITSG